MKKAVKIPLIIVGSLLLIAIIIFVIALANVGFNFNKLFTVTFETNTYDVNKSFDSISIDLNVERIKFELSEDDKCSVECYEMEKIKHKATVKDGELVITSNDKRQWYDHFAVTFESPVIKVFLPKEKYDSVTVKTATGSIDIPSDFSFDKLILQSSTGHITCDSSASGNMKISSSTGNITIGAVKVGSADLSVSTGNIKVNSLYSKGKVKTRSSTGNLELKDVTCSDFTAKSSTGNVSLTDVIASESFSIESSTGNVIFDSCDSEDITVKTSTGNVTGTLLSGKVFITHSSTGKITVPDNSGEGGLCEISTSTGNIKIDIK